MAAITVEWSADALADLNRFAVFLRDQHPALAQRIAREIIAKSQMLADHPRLGRPISGRAEYRQIVLQVLKHNMCFNIGMTGADSSCFASSMAEKAAIKRGLAGRTTI